MVPVITHTAPAVTATATPEDLKAALMAEAAGGKLTDPLIAHFKDYAAAAARQKLVPAEVSEEFWTWLAANREFRDPLLIYTYPRFDPGPYKALAALRTKFGDQVKELLAVGPGDVAGVRPRGDRLDPRADGQVSRPRTGRRPRWRTRSAGTSRTSG